MVQKKNKEIKVYYGDGNDIETHQVEFSENPLEEGTKSEEQIKLMEERFYNSVEEYNRVQFLVQDTELIIATDNDGFVLDLNHQNIISVNSIQFTDDRITELLLKGNQLNFIYGAQWPAQLAHLDLEGNQIQIMHLFDDISLFTTHLVSLNVASNGIPSLYGVVFARSIKRLILDGNSDIFHFANTELPLGLELLSISNMGLDSSGMNSVHWGKFTHLQAVYLDGNLEDLLTMNRMEVMRKNTFKLSSLPHTVEQLRISWDVLQRMMDLKIDREPGLPRLYILIITEMQEQCLDVYTIKEILTYFRQTSLQIVGQRCRKCDPMPVGDPNPPHGPCSARQELNYLTHNSPRAHN